MTTRKVKGLYVEYTPAVGHTVKMKKGPYPFIYLTEDAYTDEILEKVKNGVELGKILEIKTNVNGFTMYRLEKGWVAASNVDSYHQTKGAIVFKDEKERGFWSSIRNFFSNSSTETPETTTLSNSETPQKRTKNNSNGDGWTFMANLFTSISDAIESIPVEESQDSQLIKKTEVNLSKANKNSNNSSTVFSEKSTILMGVAMLLLLVLIFTIALWPKKGTSQPPQNLPLELP